MTVKEYMKEASCLRKRIERKENEIKLERYRASGLTGSGASDMPHTESPDLQKQEKSIAKIIELEKQIHEIKYRLNELISEMSEKINTLEDAEMRDVMIKRYIEFKEWKDIMSEMYCSRRKIFYIHEKAVNLI